MHRRINNKEVCLSEARGAKEGTTGRKDYGPSDI